MLLLVVSVAQGQKKNNTTVTPQPAVAAKPGATTQHIRRITPQIPDVNRFDPGKVFLENADKLVYNERRSTEYRVLKGNVKFRRGNMTLSCDSAYFYEAASSLDAFGHVVMVQADTMRVYCDRMHYYGDVEVAKLRHNVRVVNPSMTVTTDSLDYDMLNNVARYFGGGTVVDNQGTRVTSAVGRYEQDTRKVQFTSNVNLVNSKIKLHTDVLDYDMNTRLATIEDKTEIVSLEDGNIIYTSSGTYNLATGQGTLYNRSTVKGRDGNTIVGDVMYYDRANDKGHAQGNVVLVDDKNKQSLVKIANEFEAFGMPSLRMRFALASIIGNVESLKSEVPERLASPEDKFVADCINAIVYLSNIGIDVKDWVQVISEYFRGNAEQGRIPIISAMNNLLPLKDFMDYGTIRTNLYIGLKRLYNATQIETTDNELKANQKMYLRKIVAPIVRLLLIDKSNTISDLSEWQVYYNSQETCLDIKNNFFNE